MIDIPEHEFDDLVETAVRGLPRRFAELLENVVIVVEEEPTREDLHALTHAGDELLGLFRIFPPLPDQVVIFRRPILRIARNRGHAVRQVRETVVHELGHYFGLDDEDMAY
ncbi:MAG TPA: metallopeptidase family protein [Thermoanaerobaculia bacterium]|nr:metallopeptidase family protein [Thermoanaerobaculia bacterium]